MQIFFESTHILLYTQEMSQGTEMQINFEIVLTYNGTLYMFNRRDIFPDL